MAAQHPGPLNSYRVRRDTVKSRPSRIDPINLGMKQMGERSAENPHAAFDVEGTGDVARHRAKPARQSSTQPMRGAQVMAFLPQSRYRTRSGCGWRETGTPPKLRYDLTATARPPQNDIDADDSQATGDV